MIWKQFLTPVKSINADEAKSFIKEKKLDSLTILDVRQPKEYEAGHLPGAVLIPLPTLTDRLDEMDADQPTLVYWASGGRSRVAAQLLSGQGFSHVINLSGGINAWDGKTAFFSEERGLEMFSGEESIEKTMVVAYSLEEGLKDFYLSTSRKVESESARQLFHQLSQIEMKHQDHILEQYAKITGTAMTREQFESEVLPDVLEGGLTTEEYANLLMPNYESTQEIIELAMSIEAQALDLYLRASQRSEEKVVRDALIQISEEEKAHLASLGKLMDTIV